MQDCFLNMRAKLVVIGTSAGGTEVLRQIFHDLPSDFPAPICIVRHVSPTSPSVLHEILSRSGPLQAVRPEDNERLQAGRVYVAPPDRHLVIEPGRVRVTRGPKENRFRPAIDPLFRSAAQVYGPGVVGVILSGNLDDGTAGLWAIKQLGGTAIVQEPAEAQFSSMPDSARRHVDVDHVVPAAGIGPLLVKIANGDVDMPTPPTPPVVEVEVKIAKEQNARDAGIETVAQPSSFACPECHGVLLQLQEGGRLRFRCHTGHAYSSESLRAAIDGAIEEALWNAFRALEEGTMLMEQLAAHAGRHPDEMNARVVMERANTLRAESQRVRQLIDGRVSLSTAEAG
jgi:two-component system, chemotaxis family, protein-glutamate methylesterase/glutaminase